MFVPVIIPTQSASPHAQEMGRRIVALIRDYRLQHQDSGSTDVHVALRIAAAEAGGSARRRPLVILAAMIAFLLLAGVMTFVRSGQGESTMLVPFMIGIIIAVVGVLVMLRNRFG